MRTFLYLSFAAAFLAGCSSGVATDPSSEALRPPHTSNQVIVSLTSPDDSGEVESIREDFQGVDIRRIGETSFYVLDLPAGTDLDVVLKEMGGDARIVEAAPNHVGGSPEGGPSDAPILGSDLLSSIATQPELAALGLAQAHAASTGAGVLVAVVDTGVDFSQPFLAGHLSPDGFDFLDQDPDPSEQRNFLDDDGDGRIDEQFGHGTFIASLILAVAPDATILPVRVLDDEGYGTAYSVAGGIIWAADRGARVINVSIEMPVASDVLQEAIHYAEDRDAVIVAAAGNKAQGEVIFPARFSSVVAVAAVDSAEIAAPFTNYGSKVALVAPGVLLLGAVPQSLNPAGTAHWSGTSFSTPIVAGAAALVRALHPSWSRGEVVQRLRDTADPVDALNPALAGELGSGRVDLRAAVQ